MSKTAQVHTCETCGKSFIAISDHSRSRTKFCIECHQAWRDEQRREKEETANLEWQEHKKEERAIYEKELATFNTVHMADIRPSDETLYIIGNGFDLMHGAKSSYYDFRYSLGKNNKLRIMLEMTLTPDDIWADFEESLAHMNMDLMGSADIVDMWLDNSGFYDDESGSAAEFYMAVEAAANPIATIAGELQRSFRRWVSKLEIGTEDRPLKGLIKSEGKVLCFNYTEFVEDLYHARDVCYIHGCRKNKGEKLVLGHKPGENISGISKPYKKPRTYRQAIVDVAQDNVFSLIAEYDKELTKDCRNIIRSHQAFFDSLSATDQIVVIGHSVSPVDWDYFEEVFSAAPHAHWYFGSFGLRDLRNTRGLVETLGMHDFDVFRTDGIQTKPSPELVARSPNKPKLPKSKVLVNGDLRATAIGPNLKIDKNGSDLFETRLPNAVRNTAFAGEHLLVVLEDWERSVLLFGKSTEG